MNNANLRIYFFRHAESVANTQPDIIGGRSNESPLSDVGVEQAQRLGRLLLKSMLRPDRIFASPALRTMETARISLAEAGIETKPVISEALQEMSQGDWVGLKRDAIYTLEQIKNIEEAGKDFKAPNGESMNEVGLRKYHEWLVPAFADHNPEEPHTVFVFGHGMAIRCLVSYLENWDRQQTYETVVPNTSVTLISHTDGEWKLDYIGRDISEI